MPSPPFRAEREGTRRAASGRVRWVPASALESPTSPQLSPPPGAEREKAAAMDIGLGNRVEQPAAPARFEAGGAAGGEDRVDAEAAAVAVHGEDKLEQQQEEI